MGLIRNRNFWFIVAFFILCSLLHYIELTGKILNLGLVSGSDLRLSGVPLVEDGKLRFRVIDATVGNIPVPESQFPQIEEAVDKVFEQILFGYDAQSVVMQDGLIAIQAIPWQ